MNINDMIPDVPWKSWTLFLAGMVCGRAGLDSWFALAAGAVIGAGVGSQIIKSHIASSNVVVMPRRSSKKVA